MLERTSLITLLGVADVAKWPQISASLVNGLPVNVTMQHFTIADLIPESGELTERLEETDQGRLIGYAVRLQLYRESTLPATFRKKNVVLYIETVSGERYLLGNSQYPLRVNYTRSSGMGIGDDNSTAMQFEGSIPA